MFSRCAALGIIAGGFALTGDLNWVAAHGVRVINSHTVPTGEAPPAPAVAPQPALDAGPASAPPLPLPAHGTQSPPAPAAGLGVGPRAPTHGIAEVRIASLQAGDRIIVWIRDGTGQPGPCLALDVIDPGAGEAIVAEVATLAANGSARIAGPPRRVTVGAPTGGALATTIRCGSALTVRPAGLAPGAGTESPGTVAAIIVVSRGR